MLINILNFINKKIYKNIKKKLFFLNKNFILLFVILY